MKLLLSAAALASAALLAAVAAPALSLERWRAQPVDFELAAPAGAGGGGVVSQTLRPGRRFNLVGLRWRGSAEPLAAIRARRAGGSWSRWQALHTHSDDGPDPGLGEPPARGVSTPLWVGEADEVQYRLSRRVPGLRLHFVNVSGTATAVDRGRTAVRRAANTALVSVAGLIRARSASAAESQPAIVSRAAWGAEDCPPRAPAEYGRVRAAIVHHTVSANDYSAEEAPGIVLAICRFHRNSNGWNDIGYNFLVDKYGRLYEGRAGGIDQPVAGAQVAGYNYSTTGIASLGDHRSLAQTSQGLAAIARLIRWKLPRSGVPTDGRVTVTSSSGSRRTIERVSGHRDLNSTSCPGQALYDQLPALRARVGSLSPLPPGPGLRVSLSRPIVRYKRAAGLVGTLVGSNGSPLAGRTVLIEVRRRDGSWRGVGTAVTGADGGFAATVRPRGNRTLRARFAGDAALPATTSATLLLRVRPRFRLLSAPETGSPGARVAFRGRIAPRKRRVTQVLQLRRRGAWRRVGRKRLRVRRGRFRASFVPARRGRFRVYVVARADSKTAKGRSARAVVRVGR